MTSTITVRPARREDRPTIRRLVAAYPQSLMQRDLPRTSSFFVAEIDGRVVGCCALQIYSARLGEVRSLAVDPAHARRGVGAALVAACRERAERRRVKQLLAVTSAVEFFEKAGFSPFKRERVALFYDPPAEDGDAVRQG